MTDNTYPRPSDIRNGELELAFDGERMIFPAVALRDDIGEDTVVMPARETQTLLITWSTADPDHRCFDWVPDKPLHVPTTYVVSRFDPHGRLALMFLKPFTDGDTIHNAYAVPDILFVTGIHPTNAPA